MKLPAVVNKHKLLIGGVGAAFVAFIVWKKLSQSRSYTTVAGPSFAGTTVAGPSFAGVGRVNAANPGLADDGPGDNQVNWVAAGHAAGLDPSAYSNLTQRNEEVLYSHLPHDAFSGAPAKNFEAMRFQGSFGLTPSGDSFFTYF